jgi:hypothetical protein
MALADAPVLIGILKGQDNAETGIFDRILAADAPFGISACAFLEIPQGAHDDPEHSPARIPVLAGNPPSAADA